MSNRKKPAKRNRSLSGARNPVARPGQGPGLTSAERMTVLLSRAGVEGDLSSLRALAQDAGQSLTKAELAEVASKLAHLAGAVLRALPDSDRDSVLWQFENARSLVAGAISDATGGQVVT